MMNKPKVVAISGASGCGKTATIQYLAKALNCPWLLFDDYIDRDSYPKDMKIWFEQGADVSLIHTAEFTKAIYSQLSVFGHSQFIIIEEPFGRQRQSMLGLIDYVILLDLPLELCLARLLKRKGQTQSPAQISNYLLKYHGYFKDIYAECVAQVRADCDLIIGGDTGVEVEVEAVAGEIIHWLKSNEKDHR